MTAIGIMRIKSYRSNPAQPGSYRIGLFLYHYAHGRFAEALDEARRVDAPQGLYGHVAPSLQPPPSSS